MAQPQQATSGKEYVTKIGSNELRSEIQTLWNNPEVQRELQQTGLDKFQPAQVYPLTEAESGITPEELKIIIQWGTPLVPVAAKIIKDVWDRVILPRIRQDKGEDAITESK